MGEKTKILRAILASCALAWIGGCSEEPPPPSVEAFMDDPILLDATMVRCVANRDSVNYDPECVNAREAVERLASAEVQARRASLEAESERKRGAVRRAQEAADAARRQAEELALQRAQAEYLGLLPEQSAPQEAALAPIVLPNEQGNPIVPANEQGSPVVTAGDVPEAAGGGAGQEVPAATEPVSSDLGEIRKALEERGTAAPPEPPAEDPAGPAR